MAELLPGQAAAEPSRDKPPRVALETQIAVVRTALAFLTG